MIYMYILPLIAKTNIINKQVDDIFLLANNSLLKEVDVNVSTYSVQWIRVGYNTIGNDLKPRIYSYNHINVFNFLTGARDVFKGCSSYSCWQLLESVYTEQRERDKGF